MGYIYRIYNDVNNHVYVGQTSMRISDRWSGHLSSARNEKLSNYKDTIHKAMRKYGIDKFHIEVIEKCDNDSLNEREIYWIKYYNSFENGYNETLGGGGCQKYNHNQIVEIYKNTHNLSETARQVGCCIGTVIKVLDVAEDCGEDLQRYRNFEWAKEPIYQIDKDTLEIIDAYLKKYSEVDVIGFDNYYNDSQSERKNKPIYPSIYHIIPVPMRLPHSIV